MLKTLRATVHEGEIELLESAELPEGTKLLVTLISEETTDKEDDAKFWEGVSRTSLNAVWDNTEDDVYAQLL